MKVLFATSVLQILSKTVRRYDLSEFISSYQLLMKSVAYDTGDEDLIFIILLLLTIY